MAKTQQEKQWSKRKKPTRKKKETSKIRDEGTRELAMSVLDKKNKKRSSICRYRYGPMPATPTLLVTGPGKTHCLQ